MKLIARIDGSKKIILKDLDPGETGSISRPEAEQLTQPLLAELATTSSIEGPRVAKFFARTGISKAF